MCGIFCRICWDRADPKDSAAPIEVPGITYNFLRHRGPDAGHQIEVTCNSCRMLFVGRILWQQGDSSRIQPVESEEHVLLWNGDVYDDRENTSESDTQYMFNRIQACQSEEDLFDLLETINGPYSIIYLNKTTQRLYFARDIFGRHSLLLGKCDPDGTGESDIVVSSVLGKNGYKESMEVPAIGVFVMDLNATEQQISLKPWRTAENELQAVENFFGEKVRMLPFITPAKLQKKLLTFDYGFDDLANIFVDRSQNMEAVMEQLLQHPEVKRCVVMLEKLLAQSVFKRVTRTQPFCTSCKDDSEQLQRICPQPYISVLFSGGIDCTILALLADRFVDGDASIELINVSFGKNMPREWIDYTYEEVCTLGEKLTINDYDTPDRITSKISANELKQLCPNRKWKFVEVDVSLKQRHKCAYRIGHCVYPLSTILDESIGAILYHAAKGRGTHNGHPTEDSYARVYLVGSGADELFGGYTRHHRAYRQSDENNTKSPYERLEDELDFDFHRLPNRNLGRDDRVISDNGGTPRAPYLDEDVVEFVRGLRGHHLVHFELHRDYGAKLLLRLCGFYLGLRKTCGFAKRAMQFGTRYAFHKDKATDISKVLMNTGLCIQHKIESCIEC